MMRSRISPQYREKDPHHGNGPRPPPSTSVAEDGALQPAFFAHDPTHPVYPERDALLYHALLSDEDVQCLERKILLLKSGMFRKGQAELIVMMTSDPRAAKEFLLQYFGSILLFFTLLMNSLFGAAISPLPETGEDTSYGNLVFTYNLMVGLVFTWSLMSVCYLMYTVCVLWSEPEVAAFRGLMYLGDWGIMWNVLTFLLCAGGVALVVVSDFVNLENPAREFNVWENPERRDRASLRASLGLLLKGALPFVVISNVYAAGFPKSGPVQLQFWTKYFFPAWHTRKVVEEAKRIGPIYSRMLVKNIWVSFGIKLMSSDEFFWAPKAAGVVVDSGGD